MTGDELRISFKRNKFLYYAGGFLSRLIPNAFYRNKLAGKIAQLDKHGRAEVLDRVNYYNKLTDFSTLVEAGITIKEFHLFEKPKPYYFDSYKYLRYFSNQMKANFLFGDMRHVAEIPSIQKSRPIDTDNTNAVLLKLNKKRHFLFVNDAKPYSEKKNMLIGRAVVSQWHRMDFMEKYFSHPMCDIGQVNKTGGNQKWLKPKISIPAHLDYKFILSLEGNDVSTNLKWIMSSNSIAVMPKPKFETWFMEGRLTADVHYILIKDDYSDLEERLQYYMAHEEAALAIIKNANEFVEQFTDSKKEDIISLLVLKKYFYYTSQEKTQTATGALIPGWLS